MLKQNVLEPQPLSPDRLLTERTTVGRTGAAGQLAGGRRWCPGRSARHARRPQRRRSLANLARSYLQALVGLSAAFHQKSLEVCGLRRDVVSQRSCHRSASQEHRAEKIQITAEDQHFCRRLPTVSEPNTGVTMVTDHVLG